MAPFPMRRQDRLMQLIGMLDSPYVRRVAVTMLTAGLAFQHRPISLFRHIDEFSKISPLLKAPTLVADDGTTLLESSVILDYLATRSARCRRAHAGDVAGVPRDGPRPDGMREGGAVPLRARSAHVRNNEARRGSPASSDN